MYSSMWLFIYVRSVKLNVRHIYMINGPYDKVEFIGNHQNHQFPIEILILTVLF